MERRWPTAGQLLRACYLLALQFLPSVTALTGQEWADKVDVFVAKEVVNGACELAWSRLFGPKLSRSLLQGLVIRNLSLADSGIQGLSRLEKQSVLFKAWGVSEVILISHSGGTSKRRYASPFLADSKACTLVQTLTEPTICSAMTEAAMLRLGLPVSILSPSVFVRHNYLVSQGFATQVCPVQWVSAAIGVDAESLLAPSESSTDACHFVCSGEGLYSGRGPERHGNARGRSVKAGQSRGTMMSWIPRSS